MEPFRWRVRQLAGASSPLEPSDGVDLFRITVVDKPPACRRIEQARKPADRFLNHRRAASFPTGIRFCEHHAGLDIGARFVVCERHHPDSLGPKRVQPEIEETEVAWIGNYRVHALRQMLANTSVSSLDAMVRTVGDLHTPPVEIDVGQKNGNPRRRQNAPAVVATPGRDRLTDQKAACHGDENGAGGVHHKVSRQAMHRNELAHALRAELVIQQRPGQPDCAHGKCCGSATGDSSVFRRKDREACKERSECQAEDERVVSLILIQLPPGAFAPPGNRREDTEWYGAGIGIQSPLRNRGQRPVVAVDDTEAQKKSSAAHR